MTEEEKRVVEKSNTVLKKLTLIYFFIISAPLPFMMLVMLDNYHFSDEYQQTVFDSQRTSVLAALSFAIILVWLVLKWYKKKLIKIRKQHIEEALGLYKKENIKLYIMLGLCAYPFFFLYLHSALLLYAGMFCFLEFVIMALERPSIFRLIRNLRLKKPLTDRLKGIPEKEVEFTD